MNKIEILKNYQRAFFPPIREIARRADCSPSTVNNFFSGVSSNSRVKLVLIEAARGKPYDTPEELESIFKEWEKEEKSTNVDN